MIRREDSGEIAILHVTTSSLDEVVAAAIEAACQPPHPIIVLDFSEVLFINSAGISALLRWAVTMLKGGVKLFALNVNPHHQKLFQTVELARFIPAIQERDLVTYRTHSQHNPGV